MNGRLEDNTDYHIFVKAGGNLVIYTQKSKAVRLKLVLLNLGVYRENPFLDRLQVTEEKMTLCQS